MSTCNINKYMAEIFPIRRRTLKNYDNQSINQSINQLSIMLTLLNAC